MYCKRCGNVISENGKFCPNCGAYQNEPKEKGNPFQQVLKIYTFIFMLFFLIGVITDGMLLLLSMVGGILFILFGGLAMIQLTIPYAFCAITGLFMMFVLYLITFRRTPKNTPSLFFGLVAGGVMMVWLRKLLTTTIEDINFLSSNFGNTLSTTYVSGIVICIVGIYSLLYLMNEAPKFKTLVQNPIGKFSEILAIFKYSFKKRFNRYDSKEVYKTSKDNNSTKDDNTTNDNATIDNSDSSNDHGTN